MIASGLVSITFRQLSAGEIVQLVQQAGQTGIEWGGDIHVPHGQLHIASEVGAMTQAAGLKVLAYGSYFRLGRSEAEGLSFEKVLETALELGAPLVRVWAGTASAQTDSAGREAIAAEARQIGDLARESGVEIAFEYHGGTLTDTDASAVELLQAVNHPSVGTLWQPRVGSPVSANLEGLVHMLPWLRHVHAFHWGSSPAERLPLAQGAVDWEAYLQVLRGWGRDSAILLEFVAGDHPDAYLQDAATLETLLA